MMDRRLLTAVGVIGALAIFIIVLYLYLPQLTQPSTNPPTNYTQYTQPSIEKELENQTKEFGAIYIPPSIRGVKPFNFSNNYLTAINLIIKTDANADFCKDYTIKVWVGGKEKPFISCEETVKNRNEHFITLKTNIRTSPGTKVKVTLIPKREGLPTLGDYWGVIK